MEKPPKITDSSQIKNLSAEDLANLLEFYTNEEKEDAIPHIMASNSVLEKEIIENQAKILIEQKLNNIFLKKMWNNLNEEEKKEAASFFKELHNKINDIK